MSKLAHWITTFIDWFYRPPFNRILPLQTFRYAACGGLNSLVLDPFLYFILYNFILDKEIVHLPFIAISPFVAAFLIVFPITFFTGFWLNRNVAFVKSPIRGHIQLFRYALSVTGSILLSYLLLKLFVEIAGFYPTPSKLLTNILVAGYSYLMAKYFTFRGCETPLDPNRKCSEFSKKD